MLTPQCVPMFIITPHDVCMRRCIRYTFIVNAYCEMRPCVYHYCTCYMYAMVIIYTFIVNAYIEMFPYVYHYCTCCMYATVRVLHIH